MVPPSPRSDRRSPSRCACHDRAPRSGAQFRSPHSRQSMTLYPLVFKLGPLTVTGYGLMMMTAFLLAGWAMQRELRRRMLGEEYAADIVVAAVIGGIIGAKLWYVALTRDPGAL